MQRLTVDRIQRPRRTSEFHEEQGTATKRQTRSTRHGALSIGNTPVAFGTAQKCIPRPGGHSTAGSASRARLGVPTPQKTTANSARALFTTEKQRGPSGVALHNDKKWIQEQAQRITEYLKNAWNPGCMDGISEDFFARSNCLKQMSIKQFVSIIKYFLHFIWGNRFTVGTNYVEDIVSILQKLNYPHQINKSWLKTPNTTHSFGNVIVLFDFLMDFIPEIQMEFPLLELQEASPENYELEPDLEFKEKLLENCQQSFDLWDKQLDEEFQKIQRQTADLLVQKRCGVDGLDALDLELENLHKKLERVQKQRPYIPPDDEKECERLKKFLQITQQEIEVLIEGFKKDEQRMEQILAKKKNFIMEITRLQQENAKQQTAICKQIFSVKERNVYVEKLKELRSELQCYQRTVVDLQDRDYRQQVQLSVKKKEVTDKIEQLNAILRDITLTFSITGSQNAALQVPLNADVKTIERLLTKLHILHNKISNETKTSKEALIHYVTEIEKLDYEVSISIEPQLKALKTALTSVLAKKKAFEDSVIKELEQLSMRQCNIELEHNQLNMEIDNQKKQLQIGRNVLKKLEDECEEMMAAAENEHSKAVKERTRFLDECDESITTCVDRLGELEQVILGNTENRTPVVHENE